MEEEAILNSYMAKFKSCQSRASITCPIKIESEGRKGGKNVGSGYTKRREAALKKIFNPLLKFGITMN